jgi:FixJ family two-component response regulator
MTAKTQSPSRPLVHLVDDDESMLRALARLLEAAGYEVRSFASAETFLSREDSSERGCVVADLRMQGLDGLQLQSRLAESGNPLPVIFLTAHGDIPASVHAMRAGAEDFLTKPVRPEDLLSAVERALARDFAAADRRKKLDELRLRYRSLTPREREVLGHVLAGKINKQIAAELGLAERTIKAHRASIMAKMRVQSPAELGRIASEAGIREE